MQLKNKTISIFKFIKFTPYKKMEKIHIKLNNIVKKQKWKQRKKKNMEITLEYLTIVYCNTFR